MTDTERAEYERWKQAVILRAMACGNSYEYDVEGYDEDGNYVYGEVDACSNNRQVDGYIYKEDGTEVAIGGEWDGHDEIEAYGDDGLYYDLEVD